MHSAVAETGLMQTALCAHAPDLPCWHLGQLGQLALQALCALAAERSASLLTSTSIALCQRSAADLLAQC